MRRDEALKELRELALRQAALKSLELRVSAVENALMALEEQDRQLLVLSYVRPQQGNLQRLCQELGVEKTRIYERRNAALRAFSIAMEGGFGAEKNRNTSEHLCDKIRGQWGMEN